MPECVRKSLSPSDADEGGNRSCSRGSNNRGGSRRNSSGGSKSGAHHHPGSHDDANDDDADAAAPNPSTTTIGGSSSSSPGNLQSLSAGDRSSTFRIYDIMSDAASIAAAGGSSSTLLLHNNPTDVTSINNSSTGSYGELNPPKKKNYHTSVNEIIRPNVKERKKNKFLRIFISLFIFCNVLHNIMTT